MFSRLFKPKWQHAKPEKRIKAVTKLDTHDEADQAILVQLATQDPFEAVRLSALEKITDLQLLIKLSKKDPAEINRQQALHNISQCLLERTEQPELAEKLSALSSLKDQDLLVHIVLNSTETQLREQALSQLKDNSHLAVVVQESQRAADRVAAVQKISCPEALEQINKAAKNKDKGVFKASKEKLSALREQTQLAEEKQKLIDKLISNTQQLSRCDDFHLYTARLSVLQQQWQELSDEASTLQKSDFASAEAVCKQFIKTQQEQIAQREAEEVRKAEAIEKSQHLLAELEQLNASFTFSLPECPDFSTFQQQALKLAADWDELNKESASKETKQFSQLQNELNSGLSVVEKFSTCEHEIVQFIERLKNIDQGNKAAQQDCKLARKLLNQLNWPSALTQPDLITQLLEQLDRHKAADQKRKQQQQAKNEKLDQLLQELKKALSSGEVKVADQISRKAEQLTKQLNGQLPSGLEQRLKSLNAELQEMRDWQSYAITPKKEALCQAMEALCDCNTDVQELANEIKKLQKSWKDLDANDPEHSQALWRRFKKASDAAYAPCDEYFAEQRTIRQNNLKLRQQLCEQLGQLIADSQSDAPNLLHAEKELRRIKQEWRQYSPVDRAPGKKLQKQFDQLITDLDQPLRQFRTDNGQKKQVLVERSAALLKSNDLSSATEEIKQLQQAWKNLGPATRNQERKLWGQFRENCNTLFERYHQSEPNTVKAPRVKTSLETICNQLESLQQSVNSIELMEDTVTEVKAQLATLKSESENLPADYIQRIDTACEFVEQQKQELLQLLTEPYAALQRKAVLCEQLESAILEGTTSEVVPVIAKAWQEGPNIPDTLSSAIEERYTTLQALCQNPDQLEQTVAEQEQRLRQLCIRLEIATSQPSPAEDQALRMEYQMERLQQALAKQEQAYSLAEIKLLEYEWLCVPFAAHFEELSQRFDNQLNHIL